MCAPDPLIERIQKIIEGESPVAAANRIFKICQRTMNGSIRKAKRSAIMDAADELSDSKSAVELYDYVDRKYPETKQ